MRKLGKYKYILIKQSHYKLVIDIYFNEIIYKEVLHNKYLLRKNYKKIFKLIKYCKKRDNYNYYWHLSKKNNILSLSLSLLRKFKTRKFKSDE